MKRDIGGLLDALPSAAAVLTAESVVLQTNRHWPDAARRCFGGDVSPGPGDELLLHRSASAAVPDEMHQFLAGLRRVGSGQSDQHEQSMGVEREQNDPPGAWRVEVRAFFGACGELRLLVLLAKAAADPLAAGSTVDPTDRHAAPTDPAKDDADRQEVDHQMRRIEERYRAAAEGGLDAFFLLDAVRDAAGEIIDFGFVDLNRQSESMLSRPRSELIGRRLCELFPVNRTDGYFDRYKKVVLTGEVFNGEFAIDAEDEGILAHWIEQQVVPIGDGVAISARDITGRKRTEQQLIAQRQENQTILDALPAFIFYKDTQNKILRVNRAVCEATGLERHQIEGRHTAELYPAHAAAYHRDDLAVIRSGRPKLNYVEQLVGPDGQKRWLRTDKVPLFDEDHQPVGVIAISLDVTELKQTAEKLEISEQRFRGLFDRVPVGVIEQDMTAAGRWFETLRGRGVEDLASYLDAHPHEVGASLEDTPIRNVNQAACDLFAADNREQLVQAIRSGRTRPALDAVKFKLRLLWDRQRSGELETRYRDLQGRHFDALLRVVVPEVDGQPDLTRVMLAMTDISANRQRLFAQAQVVQAERERMRLGHELHDTLAQQITGMNMLAEGLRRRLQTQNIPEADRAAELKQMLGQANTQLRRLISGLSVQRIAPDEIETALESLAERTEMLNHLPVSFHCPRTPDELDQEAANHLLYIAQEATHNAAKHARATRVRIVLVQAEEGLTLTVADDGVGLPEADDPDRPRGDGSGLGLGIMRSRAEAIGATMEFVTSPGGGTTLSCFLPANPADPSHSPEPTDDPPRPPLPE